jgi:hypothetical protein
MGTSAAVSVSVDNVVVPPNPIANGGFETGSSPWAFAGHTSRATGSSARSGSAYALLGNRNRASGSVSQTVAIPLGARRLDFWLRVSSSDSATTANDYLYVEVVGSSSPLATFTNRDRDPAGAYVWRSLDLSSWQGQSVTLRFRVTTNNKQPTSFLVDDVSLQ